MVYFLGRNSQVSFEKAESECEDKFCVIVIPDLFDVRSDRESENFHEKVALIRGSIHELSDERCILPSERPSPLLFGKLLPPTSRHD